MIVLVTGSHGFIGSYVTDELLRRGHSVVPFDLSYGQDLRDRDALTRMFSTHEPDRVIHLAGVLGTSELFDTAHDAVDVNVHGTLSLLQACYQYDAGITLITMPRVWDNVYQATKGCADALARAWQRHFGVRVSFVRAFNAFGQGQKVGSPQKIIPTFAHAAWIGKPLPVWGDGTQQVDLIHASAIARVLADATAFGDGELFDAGTGQGRSVNEVAEMVCRMAGVPTHISYAPMRKGEHPAKVVSDGEGWDVLGWRPAFSEETLTATVESYAPQLRS